MRRRDLLLLLLLALGLPDPARAQGSAWSAGEQAGRQFISQYGSRSSLQQKLAAPLQSSAARMNPLFSDLYRCPETGKAYQSASGCSSECSSPCERGFSAQIQAPSTDAFLELFVQPSASGDIIHAVVRQDTDFDGRYDHAYTLSLPVSGVCANGFISCEPGTWSNCRYFRWTADDQGRVSSEEVPHAAAYLGGCYCINASCGAGSALAWRNIGQILEHLGGGAVGAVQERDPRLSVTAVDVKPAELTIRYYGQKVPEMAQNYASSAGSAPYMSGERSPERYYRAPALLDARLEEEIQNQAQVPDSAYWLVAGSPAAKTSPFEIRQCSVRRDFIFESDSQVIGAQIDVWMNGDYEGDTEWCYWADAKTDRCGSCLRIADAVDYNWCMNWVINHRADIAARILYNSGCVPYTDPYTGKSGCWSPSGSAVIVGDPTVRNVGCGGMPRCCPDYPCYVCREIIYDAYWDNPSSCAATTRQGDLIFCVKERPVLQKTDTCAGTDLSGCQLRDEQICQPDGSGCVYTVRNFAETGLRPLPDCIQRGSETSGVLWTVCTDGQNMTYSSTAGFGGTLESGEDVWWVVRRTYYCPQPGPYDLSGARQRMASLQESTTFTGSTLYWQDYLPATRSRSSGQAAVLSIPDGDECELVCQVRVGVPETQVGPYGHQGQYLTSTESIRDEFRPCEPAREGGWTCPYDPQKETKLRDCGCLNAFNEAVTGMQLLRDASKDIICSTTPPN